MSFASAYTDYLTIRRYIKSCGFDAHIQLEVCRRMLILFYRKYPEQHVICKELYMLLLSIGGDSIDILSTKYFLEEI